MRRQGQQSSQKKNEQIINDELYNIDQSYRKTHNSSVIDLVTPKQKQMQKKTSRFTTNQYRSDSEDNHHQPQNYEFADEGQQKPLRNQNRYQQPKLSKQSKEEVLELINKMMAKNKINSKTAFDVPVLSISDFAMYDQGGSHNDIAWSKMSSILENDYKIYGVRVDTIEEHVKKISNSLCRKQAQNNDNKEQQKKEEKQKQSKAQKQQRQAKMAELLSSEVKNNLMLHLQKNSQNLDINLRKKLMMRKDPLFQRTSRKFDHSSYSSFFLNTLFFSPGLWMQINTSENQNSNKKTQMQQEYNQQNHNKKKDQRKAENENQMKDVGDVRIENNTQNQKQGSQNQHQDQNCQQNKEKQNISTQKQYEKLLDPEILKTVKVQISCRKAIKKFRKSLSKFNIELFPPDLVQPKQAQNFQKILNMIKQNKLQSSFMVGKQIIYESSQQNQEQLRNRIQDEQARYQQIKKKEDNLVEQVNFNEIIKDQEENQGQIWVENEEAKQAQKQGENSIKESERHGSDEQERQDVLIQNQVQNAQGQTIKKLNISDLQHSDSDSPIANPNKLTRNNSKIDKKTRKIAQVIKLNSSKPKVKKQAPSDTQIITEPKTRKRTLKKQIKDIIKSEIKPIPQDRKTQKQLFDPQVKQNFKKVFKKDKNIIRDRNRQRLYYEEKNVILPAVRGGLQLKYVLEFRPLPTKEELKKDKYKNVPVIDLQKNEQQPNSARYQEPMINQTRIRNSQHQQQSSSDSQSQHYQMRAEFSLKKQTITAVKQNLYSLIKSYHRTTFKALHKQYITHYEKITTSTLYIAMLHLANERYIVCKQKGKKDFQVIVC